VSRATASKKEASIACKNTEQRDASRVGSDAWFGSSAVTLFGFQKTFVQRLCLSSSPLRLRLQKNFPNTTKTSDSQSLLIYKSHLAERFK
jgi:hypothetical protein